MPVFVPDANAQPLMAQKDKTAVTVRWAAHDDNGDDLMFAVWYRGVGEKNWRLLKDKISDKFLSFDAALLPDGRYEVKVVASDAPVHTDAEALTGERVSGEFVVDTTPPVPGVLTATLMRGAGCCGARFCEDSCDVFGEGCYVADCACGVLGGCGAVAVSGAGGAGSRIRWRSGMTLRRMCLRARRDGAGNRCAGACDCGAGV